MNVWMYLMLMSATLCQQAAVSLWINLSHPGFWRNVQKKIRQIENSRWVNFLRHHTTLAEVPACLVSAPGCLLVFRKHSSTLVCPFLNSAPSSSALTCILPSVCPGAQWWYELMCQVSWSFPPAAVCQPQLSLPSCVTMASSPFPSASPCHSGCFCPFRHPSLHHAYSPLFLPHSFPSICHFVFFSPWDRPVMNIPSFVHTKSDVVPSLCACVVYNMLRSHLNLCRWDTGKWGTNVDINRVCLQFDHLFVIGIV